ncbi:xylulokinase [Breznakiella homolactica]|uniref:Xylulose kinase n=1 Tax=Breznakiella homolactica TaxID=2798577 RepID=A0A7T8BAJ9_9SPIR|nr:xylulokinase [Breznakiella homolactica]QQO09441.1 xylulokinase [Breznakiella homolactica]
MYYMGIDCGTQGTKAIVFDSRGGAVIGKGYAGHSIAADDSGLREQDPQWWISALIESVRAAVADAGISGSEIRALAVSGQQHGLVALDGDGKVLRRAKLWNDTSTAEENSAIIRDAGGPEAVWRRINTSFPVGFTASKVRYLAVHEPELFARVRHILLPHDYINFYLTGVYATEGSEVSGTGYYDVAARQYSSEMINIIDPSGILKNAVPPVYSWDRPLGTILPETAETLGLAPGTLVACGGGDNTMGALGTSAIVNGRCAIGLGTSGTVALLSPVTENAVDRLLQVYDVIDGIWLVTSCTLNATSAANTIQDLFGLRIEELDRDMDTAPVGADGVTVIPFFSGERMPPLPSSRGIVKNLTTLNTRRENIVRAAAESVIFTLKWGFDKIVRSFPEPRELVVFGGGANSAPWRRIIADVFGKPVHCLVSDEGGALGAALQAMYLDGHVKGNPVTLQELCERYIAFNKTKEIQPVPGNVLAYRGLFDSYKREIEKEWGISLE